MQLNKYTYFYLFVSFLFIAIAATELFSEGMFMDGLWYADISRNLAEGIGSFWKPQFTQTLYPEFYEHPTLAFGLQSIFFSIFGDSIFVERFYSLGTFVIVGYLIVKIWELITGSKKDGWIPLFLWLITGGVAWAVANNMLENTMTIFVCFSLYACLKRTFTNQLFWIIFAGISLSLGVLTKGFVCLYIWGVPFFLWLFTKKATFSKTVLNTILIIVSTILPIALLYYLVPDAQNNMLRYFEKQVVGSIENVATVESRFAIIKEFFISAIIPIAVVAITILSISLTKINKSLFNQNLKYFLLFTCITASGVLPIMVSMKQRSFYISTVYPIFAIGLAYYIYPFVQSRIERVKEKSKGFVFFKVFTILIIITATTLTIIQANRIGRDKDVIHDSKMVINEVGKNNIISICPELFSEWSLHGYFSRYGNVSLSIPPHPNQQYFLSKDNCLPSSLKEEYKQVAIQLKKYTLYQKK